MEKKEHKNVIIKKKCKNKVLILDAFAQLNVG